MYKSASIDAEALKTELRLILDMADDALKRCGGANNIKKLIPLNGQSMKFTAKYQVFSAIVYETTSIGAKALKTELRLILDVADDDLKRCGGANNIKKVIPLNCPRMNIRAVQEVPSAIVYETASIGAEALKTELGLANAMVFRDVWLVWL